MKMMPRCNAIEPLAIASDGCDSCPEAMLETRGKVPEYSGRGEELLKRVAIPDCDNIK